MCYTWVYDDQGCVRKVEEHYTTYGEVTRKVANVSWVCRLHSESQLSLSASKGGLVTTAVYSLTNENVRILSHDQMTQ